ncbi:hypothetical protein IGI04_005180, partial [Brassica rapa subsp. trilocularis]
QRILAIKPSLTGAPDKLSWLSTDTGEYSTKTGYAAKTLPPTGVSIGALAPWIVWQLWLARNKLVFEDKIITIEEVVSKAVASAREWITSQDQLTQPTRLIAPPTMLQADYVLLRTDAAWNESLQLAGLGWTTKRQGRDSSFSSIAHHVATPLAAEGLALREALLKCRDMGLSKIRCESDSAILIKAINANSPLVGLYGILADINSIASSFESISFNWISRERNGKADGLAKNVLSSELAIMAAPNSV